MSKHKIANFVFALLVCLAVFTLWRVAEYRYDFRNPEYLWLLILVPLALGYYIWRNQKLNLSVNISTLHQIPKRVDLLAFARPLLLVFRYLSLALFVIALARPQSKDSFQNAKVEGIDIMIALDISASMLAKDFQPNRLDGSKDVAIDFIKNRKDDRIGLVVYEGESFTQCPLTTDHNVLINLFKDVKTGYIQGGTAIGMGLATAVNRLRDSEAKSKVVILLTDGVNNQGSIAPMTAADIAKEFGIKVYTIGVGSKGKALSPVAIYPNGEYQYDYVDVNIDELTLEKIAFATGGKYYRATDNKDLKEIYDEINKLEKTKIKVTEFTKRNEEYFPVLVLAFILLSLEWLFKSLIFRSIP